MSDVVEQRMPLEFIFKTTKVIRVIIQDGNPWFVTKDICDVLDVVNSRHACSRLDDDEKGYATIMSTSGNQKTSIVNEPGLYTLILSSRKPVARVFKKWVVNDILPTIRRVCMVNDYGMINRWRQKTQQTPTKNHVTECMVANRLAATENGKREVTIPNGRVDVLTDGDVIEVKHHKGWKGALGQVMVYALHFPQKRKRIHLWDASTMCPSERAQIEECCHKYGVCVTFDDS